MTTKTTKKPVKTTAKSNKDILKQALNEHKGTKKNAQKEVSIKSANWNADEIEIKNHTPAQMRLRKLILGGIKNKQATLTEIREVLDLANGRVSEKGKKALLEIAMGFKKDAQGVRDSEGYRANDSLNHNIKDAFKPFVKDPKNALKDGDILCLVNVGTKPNSPKFNRKDFKPVLSVEQSEKKRIAKENKENAEKLAFLNAIQQYANGLTVDEFNEWYKGIKDQRAEFLKKKISKS
jgi:hypothetical protein